VPILKAAVRHNGFALVDIISPCVSFNDHDASTKSYRYTREHLDDAPLVDFVPLRREITADSGESDVVSVTMHDGSVVRFHRVPEHYDPTDRQAAYNYVREHQARGEIVAGLLHIEEGAAEMHDVSSTVETPLVELPFETLCPGSGALAALMDEYR
jgi:2-oxoglutarate ferredoxin oxidoreductase subunit beta